MLQHMLVFAAILLLSHAELKKDPNESIFCHKVDFPLDFETIVGTWHMIASIEPAETPKNNKTESYNCMDAEFIGMLREYSRDLMMQVEGAETLYLKDVEEADGMKTTRGCYQKAKNLDEGVFRYNAAKYIDLMMMQFFLVESTELLLVQNVWHTVIPGRIALVYAKSLEKDLQTDIDIQPAVDLITKISGKPQSMELCWNTNFDNDNNLPPMPKMSKN